MLKYFIRMKRRYSGMNLYFTIFNNDGIKN